MLNEQAMVAWPAAAICCTYMLYSSAAVQSFACMPHRSGELGGYSKKYPPGMLAATQAVVPGLVSWSIIYWSAYGMSSTPFLLSTPLMLSTPLLNSAATLDTYIYILISVDVALPVIPSLSWYIRGISLLHNTKIVVKPRTQTPYCQQLQKP